MCNLGTTSGWMSCQKLLIDEIRKLDTISILKHTSENYPWNLNMSLDKDFPFNYCWWLKSQTTNGPMGCIKAIVHNGIKLPVPQLVSLPDFWLPSTVSGFFDVHVSPRLSGTEKIVGTRLYMGVSWNDGIPKLSPQNDPFLVGKAMVVGETHPFRSCPHKTLW